jgi:thiol-disulfide isomerase/thioredoxin
MKYKLFITLLAFMFLTNHAVAAPAQLKTFTNGSYQQLLTQNKNKPFTLIIWSTTCSSCLKEMPLIKKLHQANPKFNIVMLTVDDALAITQIHEVLEKNHLTDLEQWVFNEDNSEKLRFEIDPSWYGELPRTYFFNAAHQRTAISGVLPAEKFNALLTKISN